MSCKTLWHRYPAQCQAQPAYLEIRESGDIHCDWDAEVGNAVPARVWHNIDMRFRISNELSDEQIEQLIAEVRPLADKLLALTEVAWDGSNHKRKLKDEQTSSNELRAISEKVLRATTMRDLFERITMLCEELESDHVEHCGDESCDHCNFEG
jgi:hypothetical protein